MLDANSLQLSTVPLLNKNYELTPCNHCYKVKAGQKVSDDCKDTFSPLSSHKTFPCVFSSYMKFS